MINGLGAAGVAFLVVAVAPVVAQQTLLVGPGQPFTDPQLAINASSPGDTIVVLPSSSVPGYFTGLVIGHPLTIRAASAAAAPVRILGSGSVTLAPGEHLHLQSLELDELHVHGGVVTCEDVTFAGPPVLAVLRPVLFADQTSMVLRSSRVQGEFEVDNAAVAAIDSTFRSPSVFALSGPAVSLTQSTGFFSRCTFQNISPTAGSQCLQVNAGSRADLVDSSLQVVPSPGFAWPLMPTLVVNAGGTARQHRCTFSDGFGGSGIVGTVQAHQLLGVSQVESALVLGGTMTAQFHAEPQDVVFVLASFDLDAPTPAPLVEPEQWGFATHGFNVTLLSANAAGATTFGMTIPNLPALRGSGVWLMGVAASAFPLPLSAPVGGLLR